MKMRSYLKTVASLALILLIACGGLRAPALAEASDEFIDYAALLRLDMTSNTLKQEVTVKTFVDGDTTHFNVPETVMETGVLKARYLAVDTPESTGKIEEYGKKASNYTREKLSAAESIIVESDSDRWNTDSTGGRHLVWVWYKTADMDDYRNLNVELLQNGLAIANSSANNRYGDACMAAIAQARANKLNVYSGQRDPDFYYGGAVELTIKELRCHPEAYDGIKVAFSGVVTMHHNNSVYMEDFDPETGLYFGISVYYGYALSGGGMSILHAGNEARIVGTMQFYEAGGVWQVTDIRYRAMKPNDPNNIQLLSEGHAAAYVPVDADTLMNGVVSLDTDEGAQTCAYAELAQATTVEVRGLTVQSVSAGADESAMFTLLCDSNGVAVPVRTVALYDQNNQPLAADSLAGKTLTVRGIVGRYDGAYQINVYTADGITIQ